MDSNHRPLGYQPSALTSWAISPNGGDKGIRTLDPLLAKQVLSQLSYTPTPSRSGVASSSYLRFLLQGPQNWTITETYFNLSETSRPARSFVWLPRKEVIQPHLPIRLPCYDFTPITSFTFGDVLLAVRLSTSGPPGSHGVTGGVYKARERIHRGMLIRDY